jgi:hypothetical protein
MQTKVEFLEEPVLEFRYGQKAIDPKIGLALFGPVGVDHPAHPKNILWRYWNETRLRISKCFL